MEETARDLTPDLASPWARLGARLVDGVVVLALTLPLWPAVGTSPLLVLQLLALLVGAVYEVAFVTRRGQTPGKMLLGVRVVVAGTDHVPDLGRAVTRWGVPTALSLVPVVGPFLALAAFGVILWDPLRRGWHDRAAGTLVVRV